MKFFKAWGKIKTFEDIKEFVNHVGYPVLVRPSYVLSGAAMKPAEENMSDYCSTRAPKALEDLVMHLNTRYIAVSYNNCLPKMRLICPLQSGQVLLWMNSALVPKKMLSPM